MPKANKKTMQTGGLPTSPPKLSSRITEKLFLTIFGSILGIVGTIISQRLGTDHLWDRTTEAVKAWQDIERAKNPAPGSTQVHMGTSPIGRTDTGLSLSDQQITELALKIKAVCTRLAFDEMRNETAIERCNSALAQLLPSGARTITATFAQIKKSNTASNDQELATKAEPSTTTPTTQATTAFQGNLTLTATPSAGYKFIGFQNLFSAKTTNAIQESLEAIQLCLAQERQEPKLLRAIRIVQSEPYHCTNK